MKILITGASGFIGRNLKESLEKRHEIAAPGHIELDLFDRQGVREFFRRHSFDAVIHAAGKPGHRNAKDPTNICYVNSRQFFNLYENRDCFGRILVTGSGAIYDQGRSIEKACEEQVGESVPADEHGLFRYMTERFIEQSSDIVDLRLFGVFGKYEDAAIRFISNAICKTLFDLPVTLRQNRRFDYLYINDLTPIVEYFLEGTLKYSAYNITPDSSVELAELARKVIELSGKDLPLQIATEGMGAEYSGNNNRLREEMPGVRFTEIDWAIEELYAWYRDHLHLLNRDTFLIDK